MKILRIYLDTSVIWGCFDQEFAEYSNILLNEVIERKIIGIISDITIKELSFAPDSIFDYFNSLLYKFEIIKTNDEIE
jgi:hypothetical protein